MKPMKVSDSGMLSVHIVVNYHSAPLTTTSAMTLAVKLGIEQEKQISFNPWLHNVRPV